MPATPRTLSPRYGVAEIYGKTLVNLSANEIRALAAAPLKSQPCPFRGGLCNKKGGVCTLRVYEKQGDQVVPHDESLVTVCPRRFQEGNRIFQWVGETLLRCPQPAVVREVPFLVSTLESDEGSDPDAVGQIDMVLIDPAAAELQWCALEIQAVYFSGPGMTSQFEILRQWPGPGVPFPDKVRRPDFRSSGPKRLMPQLQTKVPTLRRWGKKMAVVIDLPFWKSLGAMDHVPDVSNCDVAWFIVTHERHESGYRLIPHAVRLTTLERAVEGLTGGRPMSLPNFEAALRLRLSEA